MRHTNAYGAFIGAENGVARSERRQTDLWRTEARKAKREVMSKLAAHTVLPFLGIRLPMVDGGRMKRQKATVWAGGVRCHLLPGDSPNISFRPAKPLVTAFIIACLAAIDVNKRMHAYRDWRNRLILFDDVDVNTLFEVEADGKKTFVRIFSDR